MKKIIGIVGAILIPFSVMAKDGDIEIEGTIAALSDVSVTVNAQVIALSTSTEYELANGTPTTLSAFEVGDLVEVKANLINGELVAREMEFEDEGSNDDSSSSSSSSSSGEDDDSSSSSGGHGSGKNGTSGNANGKSKVEIKAKLRSGTSSSENPHGNATRKSRDEGNDKSRDRFKIKLEFVGDDGSVDRDIRADVSSAGVLYATCYLDQGSSDDDEGELETEYKVDLEQRSRDTDDEFRVRRGECDTDLVTDGVQNGIPDAVSGDTVRVYEQLESSQVELVSGTFFRKK